MNTIAVLRDIIEKHPTSLADDRTIRALLMDYFPGDKRAQNTLMMVVETGVLADMAGKQEIDRFHMYGYIRSVVADYGVSEVIAKRAVSDWAAALGISAEDVSVEDTAVTRQRAEPGVLDYSAVTSSDLVIYGKIIKFSGKGPKVTPEIIIPPGTYLAQAKPGIAARVYDAGANRYTSCHRWTKRTTSASSKRLHIWTSQSQPPWRSMFWRPKSGNCY